MTEELASRRKSNVVGTVTDTPASAAAAAMLDEPLPVPRPPFPLLPPPSIPPPAAAASFAVATDAAVAAAVLAVDFVEGSPGEEEDGTESLTRNGFCADLWNS